jgi:GT2 family glycosyltransferase
VDVIRKLSPETRIISLECNTGFVNAINTGAAAARSEFLVFLNNDMRVSCGWLSAFATVISEKNADCVTGKILSWDGRHVDFVEGILLFDGHALQRKQGVHASAVSGDTVRRTFIACGGNMAIRRSLFLKLGGFDPAFFAYTEDVDFSWRLNASGGKIFFSPDAVVYHHHQGTSTGLGVYNRGFLYERNAFLNLYKNIDALYFPAMMHAAWLTLMHRTREIVSLNAANSAVFGQFPFSESYDIPQPMLMNEMDLATRLRSCLETRGFLYAIGRFLEKMGILIQRKSVPETPIPIPEIHLGHPHIVSQMQALWYILANWESFHQKRLAVQSQRKVSDKELFGMFPPWVVTTYPGDGRLFASASFRELLPADIQFKFADIRGVHGVS